MPQARNRRAATDLCPVGKGSLYSSLANHAAASRNRAQKVNEGELYKLQLHIKTIDKTSHANEMQQTRIMERMNKGLKELTAYQSILNDSFRVDHFDTLKFGYQFKEARRDPARFQRFVYESRIYHSGFSISSLRREVDKRMKELDPETQLAEKRRRNLQLMMDRNRVVEIDRKQSNSAILKGQFRPKRPKYPIS